MTPRVFHEFEDACLRLSMELPQAIPGVRVRRSVAGVPTYPHYDQREPAQATGELEAAMLVLINTSERETLAIVPVALYETGNILASAAFSGSLSVPLRQRVSEVLVLRDQRWVCLGSTPLPSRRFPTLDLIETVRGVLTS